MNLPKDFLELIPLRETERLELIDAIQDDKTPVSVRFNPWKANPVSGLKPVQWCEHAFYLSERPSFTADPAFHAGAYYPQEASSMFLDRVLESLGTSEKPLAVLDLCAAPGGKSTLIRSRLKDDDFLISNEIVPKRASILLENIQKWGHENTAVSNLSPQSIGQSAGIFDIIVVDAPCSGEGLFRKQADAVEEWSLKNVDHCALRQRQILGEIWPSLKEGGILIYSTCTYNRIENEENLHWLNDQKDVEFQKIPLTEGEGITEVSEGEIIGYRFFPHLTIGEGFFLSAVRKTSPQRSKKIKRSALTTVFDKDLSQSVHIDDQHQVFALTETGQKVISSLVDKQKVFSPGYHLGMTKKNRYIPDHGYYLWRGQNSSNRISLNYQESIDYLRGDDVKRAFDAQGKFAVDFQGFTIGSGKLEKSRLVSKYPKNYRIRMREVEGYQQIALSKD